MRLLRIFALIALVLALTPSPAVAVTGYDSAYNSESAFVTIDPGETKSFQVFFINTGSVTWINGSSSQVDLAACREDKVTCNAQDASEAPWNSGWLSATRYATHTQTTVAPGATAAFAYNIKAPADGTGTHRFNGDLVLAATGERIHPEGYYQDATVEAIGNIPLPTPTPAPVVILPPRTPRPTPTPVPLGTLTVEDGQVAVTGCPSEDFALQFAVGGLTPETEYFLKVTRDGFAPSGVLFETDEDGNFGITFDTEAITPPASFTWVVTANEDDNTPKTNSVTATFVCAADLSVTKTDSPDPVLAGINLTYTITISNAGPDDAEQVSVSDVIPANTTFVSITAPGWMTSTPAAGDIGTVIARRPRLADEASATFTLVVKVNGDTPAGTTITNTATVRSATSDPNSANDSDTETTGTIGTLTVDGLPAATVCGTFDIVGTGLALNTEYFLLLYSPAITPPPDGGGVPPTFFASANPNPMTDDAGAFGITFNTGSPLTEDTQYQAVVTQTSFTDYKTNPVTFTVNCTP
ncbi:MAG: DUF11 domain-containing protein [Chloroflexota bacterium]